MATKTILIEDYPLIHTGKYKPVSSENSERYSYGRYWVDYYPLVFSSPVRTSYIELSFDIWSETNTSYLYNTNWTVWIYTGSSWKSVKTFTMPSAQDYVDEGSLNKYTSSTELTVDLDGVYTVSKLRIIPSSSVGHSSWNQSQNIRRMSVQVSVEEHTARQSEYFCGIQHKRYGAVYKNPAAILVNIDGELKTVTEIMINTGGQLQSAKHMQEFTYSSTEKEQVWLIRFTAIKTGRHEFSDSNWNAAWMTILDSNLKQMRALTTDGFTEVYPATMAENLTAGETYYLLLVDDPSLGINKNQRIKITI